MPWTPIIAGPLPAVAAVVAGPQPEAPAVEAVLLRSEGVDPAALLDALQLRSPQRALAIPPWPAEPAERFGLFAVATVRHEGGTLEVTVVLSDGRAYYRTLESTADGAPRVAASTVANLMAAIEEDALPPDEEDVPLPPEPSEPTLEVATEPEPEPAATTEPEPAVERPPEPPPRLPLELEPIVAGTLGFGLGPPAPTGFVGGGGSAAAELRWPSGALVSLALRSHWHRPEPLTVGRTRISVGGGYAWRRGRVELRTVLALDVEPWGVRRGGARESVAYPDGQARELGLQLGGHLRVVPAFRFRLGPRLRARVGPRLEVAGGALAQAAGVARLLVSDGSKVVPVARVGGLELSAGIELGVAWTLQTREARRRRGS